MAGIEKVPSLVRWQVLAICDMSRTGVRGLSLHWFLKLLKRTNKQKQNKKQQQTNKHKYINNDADDDNDDDDDDKHLQQILNTKLIKQRKMLQPPKNI